MPTISADNLTQFAASLLTAGGLSEEEARLIAQSLVGANLRGYDSHGVMRIPFYLDRLKKGEAEAGAKFEVLTDAPSLMTVDAHWGLGQTQARRLTERLIEKAKTSGVAVGTMIHCSHIGRLGEYCEMAAEAGLISMLSVNNHGAVTRVAPPGGRAPRLSTNPMAFGIPNGDEPLVLDFCTSATAEGKVRVKKIAGELCPDGWLLDSEGQPTNDPNDLYADPPGTIRPMGGDQPYKGFGLSLIVEILSGALSGGVCAREVPINQIGNCVFLVLFNPDHFGGREHFATEVTSLLEFVRTCPRIDGVDAITLPGDPERHTLAKKTTDGVTFDEGNWKALVALAGELEVGLPDEVK